jgi:hypothetical protein
MSVYLKLLHGRDDPRQQMNDWGYDGPVLGPFEAVHFTYATHVRCFPQGSDGDSEAMELCYHEDMLVHGGKFYGDFEIATSFGPDAPGLLATLQNQTDAAQNVIDAWDQGDLAAAVQKLAASIPEARAVISKAAGRQS